LNMTERVCGQKNFKHRGGDKVKGCQGYRVITFTCGERIVYDRSVGVGNNVATDNINSVVGCLASR